MGRTHAVRDARNMGHSLKETASLEKPCSKERQDSPQAMEQERRLTGLWMMSLGAPDARCRAVPFGLCPAGLQLPFGLLLLACASSSLERGCLPCTTGYWKDAPFLVLKIHFFNDVSISVSLGYVHI